MLIEGSLISSIYEQPTGKGKNAKTAKVTSWSIRADVVRKLDRGDAEPEANPSGSIAPEGNGAHTARIVRPLIPRKDYVCKVR